MSTPTARHAQFERAFDPNITFRADTYPHWVENTLAKSKRL